MNLMDMELEMELKALRSEIDKLKKENAEYKKVLIENDLSDEIGIEKITSPEEEICLLGIEQILTLVRQGVATKEDVQNFDILHKNLRMIRGQATDKKREKPTKIADLLKIVEGDKS